MSDKKCPRMDRMSPDSEYSSQALKEKEKATRCSPREEENQSGEKLRERIGKKGSQSQQN
jgi:hypothetical protein